MAIDFSLLKEINFANPENLIFLVIILVLVAIIFFILVATVVRIIKFIKRIIVKIFNIDTKKPKFDQKSTDWLHQPQAPKPKIIEEDFIRNPAVAKEKNTPEGQKQKYQEQEQKDIAEGLSRLESSGSADKDTLESKMPLRPENQEENANIQEEFQKIKIPTPKHFQTTDNDTIKAAGSVIISKNNTIGSVPIPTKLSPKQDTSPIKNPDFLEDKLGVHSGHQVKAASEKTNQSTNKDQSIFKGGSEVSRTKLKEEMEDDPNVWRAARQEGLNLSPTERANLVKEVFSPALGTNISKTDLKLSVKKLNQKMLGTKDQAQHAKLREEIKFFKKIGGI